MIHQEESSSTSLARKEKALVITALSDAALDEIASVAGVSRSTVRRFVAACDSRARRLSREAKDLLGSAMRVHANERETVYFLQAEGTRRIKIGTTKNLTKRLKALRAGSPVRLRLVGAVRGGHHLERILHMAFAPLRCGRSEWFEPGASLVSYVRELRRREVAR